MARAPYTAESEQAVRPRYLSVNVYLGRCGYSAVVRLMRAGGRRPQTIQVLADFQLPAEAATLSAAALAAAEALRRFAEDTAEH
jgi:hypothetical protein